MNNNSYKNSRQRNLIFELLKSTDSHPTADWIYAQLKPDNPGLSLGTVYRNLRVLKQQGLIQGLDYGSGFERFDAAAEPHYHFKCNRCERVYDLKQEYCRRLDEEIQQFSNFTVTGHRLEFSGICLDCRTII